MRSPENGSVRLGLQLVKDVGDGVGEAHSGGEGASRPLMPAAGDLVNGGRA